MTKQPFLNVKPFADPRNSSSLPVTHVLAGDPVWDTPSALAGDPLPAAHLALTDSLLLIYYGSALDVRRLETGVSLWQRRLTGFVPFDLKANGLVTLDQAGYYQILGFDQKFTEPLSLPFLTANTVLYFSRTLGEDMIYCYQTIPTPTNAPGDKFLGPNFSFCRFNPKGNRFVWQFNRPEMVVDVLESSDGARIAIVTATNIYLFPSEAQSDSAVTTIAATKILTCALDNAGNLLVLQQLPDDDGGLTLMLLDSHGGLTWKCPFGQQSHSPQPPAGQPDGAVYLAVGGQLVRLEQGTPVWSAPLPGEFTAARFTALSDGSILVVSGQTLTQLSRQGEVMRTKVLKDTITCRPVMDAQGRVYVAGRHTVTCLE